MTKSVRIRIIAFILLSAIGIVYVSAEYLGIVDKILGRGFTIHATLPSSGGLYVGSEVDYRGVKIGRVSAMSATADGVRVDMALQDKTQLPVDSPFYVHDLSAVGEQYVDFEPTSTQGPYAEDNTDYTGNRESLPTDTSDLLIQTNQLVQSVNKGKLQILVKQLGLLFDGTGTPLQQLIDDGGHFVRTANAHTAQTIRLLNNAVTVLGTQQAEGDNITQFSHQLRLLTDTLRGSDGNLRRVIDGTPGAAVELDKLVKGLQPTLPVLLSDLVNINSVVVSHLAGTEQLLVTYPRVIAGGFTGSPGDGYGHVNLQFDNAVQPCTQGYKPRSQWRQPNVLTDAPIYPARCTAGPPYVMRGSNYVPGTAANPAPGRTYDGSYDPRSGLVDGVTDKQGKPVRFVDPGNLSIMGDDSWKWLLVGPVATK